MSGEKKTALVAIGMVLFSLVNILLIIAFGEGAGLGTKAVRLTLTCVFAFFLFLGEVGRRHIVATGCAIGWVWPALDGWWWNVTVLGRDHVGPYADRFPFMGRLHPAL